jgi:hypothetical protein
MSRVLGIELRRSAAVGSALTMLVIGVVLLFFAEGIGFKEGWMQLAMTQRLYLAVLWPLALAAGAWQARREHRTNVTELFASTPRPRASRMTPTLGAMALAVVCGYLAQGIAGGLWIIGSARYLPVGVFVVTAVGALALIAAAWLGLAIGRLLPQLVTAPALGVAGLALLLLIPGATRPRGWLALVFSPIYEMNMPGPYATVPGRISGSQTIWLVALAVTAVLLFTSSGWRIRLAALLPVVAGAALAIAVMPHQNRLVTDGVDKVAQALVCADGTPRVCVSRVHSSMLPEVTTQARQGLAILAKLPGAPTEVHEDTTTYGQDVSPPWQENVVLLRVEADKSSRLARVVTGAFDNPPTCQNLTSPTDRTAAAYWLMGRAPEEDEYSYDPMLVTEATAQWQKLRQLPENDAKARVVALRQAAHNCTENAGLFDKGTQ